MKRQCCVAVLCLVSASLLLLGCPVDVPNGDWLEAGWMGFTVENNAITTWWGNFIHPDVGGWQAVLTPLIQFPIEENGTFQWAGRSRGNHAVNESVMHGRINRRLLANGYIHDYIQVGNTYYGCGYEFEANYISKHGKDHDAQSETTSYMDLDQIPKAHVPESLRVALAPGQSNTLNFTIDTKASLYPLLITRFSLPDDAKSVRESLATPPWRLFSVDKNREMAADAVLPPGEYRLVMDALDGEALGVTLQHELLVEIAPQPEA